MSFYKIKNRNVICFSKVELSSLFEISKKSELLKEMLNKNISMEEISNSVSHKGSNDRDEHEIFLALFIFLDFYGDESEVCFELNHNFNPHKNKISILKDLNNARANDSISDFIIKSKNDWRQFQLKRYRDELNTQKIFDFINEKVRHYGNNLGDTNLLIVLQPPIVYTITDISFHKLYEKVKSLNLKFGGQILILYNKNNNEQVIIQVYPQLTISKIPLRYPSEKTKVIN